MLCSYSLYLYTSMYILMDVGNNNAVSFGDVPQQFRFPSTMNWGTQLITMEKIHNYTLMLHQQSNEGKLNWFIHSLIHSSFNPFDCYPSSPPPCIVLSGIPYLEPNYPFILPSLSSSSPSHSFFYLDIA